MPKIKNDEFCINEIASEFLTKSPTLALVGPFKSEAKFEKVLKS